MGKDIHQASYWCREGKLWTLRQIDHQRILFRNSIGLKLTPTFEIFRFVSILNSEDWKINTRPIWLLKIWKGVWYCFCTIRWGRRMKVRHGTMCCPIHLKTIASFLCRRSSRSNAQTAAWQESRSFIICSDSKIFWKKYNQSRKLDVDN